MGGTLGLGAIPAPSDPAARAALVNQMLDITVPFVKATDDAMATDATANTKIGWVNPYDFDVYLVGAKYSANGTITASDSAFATITFKTDDNAAGTPAVAATWATTITGGTGNIAAHVSVNAVITRAGARIVPGAGIWFNIAKTGAGVVVRAGTFTIRLQKAE